MKKLTPLGAIRQNCLDCSGGSATEVKSCTRSDCPLYTFRFGKNPQRKGVGSVGNFSNRIAQATKPLTDKVEAGNAHSTEGINPTNEF